MRLLSGDFRDTHSPRPGGGGQCGTAEAGRCGTQCRWPIIHRDNVFLQNQHARQVGEVLAILIPPCLQRGGSFPLDFCTVLIQYRSQLILPS